MRAERIWRSETGSSLRIIQAFESIIQLDNFAAFDLGHGAGEAFGNLWHQQVTGMLQNLPAILRRQRFDLMQNFRNAHA